MYHSRDFVEKRIYDLKTHLNCDRFLCSSDKSLRGKIFIFLLSMIIVSRLRMKIKNANLSQDYTLRQLIREFDKIKAYKTKNNKVVVQEILKSHNAILKQLDLPIIY